MYFISLYFFLFALQYNLMKIFYDRNANNRNSGSDPSSLRSVNKMECIIKYNLKTIKCPAEPYLYLKLNKGDYGIM